MPLSRRVLWVEDDQGQFAPVVRRLQEQGIAVTRSRTLAEASAVMEESGHDVRLIVCDNIIRAGADTIDESIVNDENPGLRFLQQLLDEDSAGRHGLLLTFFPPAQSIVDSVRESTPSLSVLDKHGVSLRGLVKRIVSNLGPGGAGE